MWHTLRLSPSNVGAEFVSSATELMRGTSRSLIVATAAAYAVWHIAATVAAPTELGSSVWLVTPVVAMTCMLALWLLSRDYLASQVVWQAGLAGAITLAVYLFQQPEIAFLYALLPLIAVVSVGWPAGLLAEGLVVLLSWWLSHGLLARPAPATYVLGVVVGGAFTGLLGWASAHTLLTATEWSFSSFELARKRADTVLAQRVELVQTQ